MSKMDIQIIYEDDNMVAVNKPSGLVVHGDGKTAMETLSDWVIERYPETENVGEPIKLSDSSDIPKHGIVHRLDRETSGVMLVAKNQDTFLYLKRQFQERTIKKVYRAIVHGSFKERRGTVDKPIGKGKKDFRRWSTGTDARGTLRDAVTEYKVLCGTKDFSQIEVYPKTGRTHQIRVHMRAISHPVACDRLYAPKKECSLGLNRVALHALSIDFLLPDCEQHSDRCRGVNMKLEAPIPEDFKQALGQIGCEIQ